MIYKLNDSDNQIMTKILFFSVIMSVLISACSDNSNDKPFFRKPMTVVIQQNAAWDGFIKTTETPAVCKDFVLTEDDVKAYFQVARVDTEREYSYGEVMSRCFAEGELTLPRKHKGKWRIDRARRGILMIEGDQTYFFYCDECVGREYTERK